MSVVPPDRIVKLACEVGASATCQKSHRGVVVFETITPAMDAGLTDDLIIPRGAGYNGPPQPVLCDGTEACRKNCPSIAVHAERRALDAALHALPAPPRLAVWLLPLERCDVLHVKVDAAGKLVPGGTPSCAECSKHILDLGVQGVWLFEETDCPSDKCPLCTGEFCMQCTGGCEHDAFERHQGRQPPQGEWNYYGALDFHTRTLAHERNRLYRGPIAETERP